MGCPTEVVIGDTLVFSICTHDPDTGVLTDAAAAPAYFIYEDETEMNVANGTMAKLDDANTTGFYTESITCSALAGYEDGKTYTIYIEATVDGDKGGICYGFKAVTGTWDVTGAITSIAMETLVERIYEMINNKMNITDATGAVALRNLADGANVATGSVTDDLTTTVRAALTWA